MYDLVIKGGRIIDSTQNIDDNLDVAISGRLISKAGKDILGKESYRAFQGHHSGRLD